jgi:hypothetical protein
MHRVLFVLAVCVAVTAGACADFEAPKAVMPPDVLVATPSFANDIQPIFTLRCATSSCHSVTTHQVGMTLAAGHSYDNIVNRQSVFRPSWKRIVPFKPDSSFLIKVLLPDSATQHPEITRMPLGRPPLTSNQIQTIINWVAQGAPRN